MALLVETKILNDYMNGNLNGIYISNNCFYMPLRFTGTGLTIRQDKNEQYYIIDRSLELFTNEEILNALNGLPILLQHPTIENNKTLLNYETFKTNSIIGICLRAYVKNNNEIWTIGRFYDLDLLKLFNSLNLSTSPCIVSSEIIANNGTSIEVPLSFNHLAICENGYWDKYSKNKALENENVNFCKFLKNSIKLTNIQKGDDNMAINSADDIEIKNLNTEVKTNAKADSENDNALDQSLDKRIENLEKVEKEEGEKMAEVAKNHKDLKEDETKEEAKVGKEEEKAAINDLKAEKDEKKGFDTAELDDKIKQAKDNEKAEELKEKEDEEDDTKEEAKKDDDTIDLSLPFGEDDEARDKIIETITNLCDSVDSSIGLKNVYVGKREKPNYLINRILKANANLIPEAYKQLIKSDSFIKGGNELAKKAFADFEMNIQNKNKEIQNKKEKLIIKSQGYQKVGDYTYIDSEF